jgi:gliding motility-associated-like protein
LVLQKPIPESPLGQNIGLLVNASASLDSDGDGVVDGIDRCPGTPPGITVDQFGCFRVNITANTPVCAGDSLVLESSNAGTGSTYQWTTPTGQIITGKRIVINNLTPADEGRYRLQIIDVYSCVRIDSIDIVLNAPPIVTVSSDPTICRGASVQLNAGGGTVYSWSPSTGLNNPNIANPVASPLVTTIYKVVVRNAAGCRDSANVIVNVEPPLSITSSGNGAICHGDSAQLNVSGGSSYQWFPANGLSNPSIANPKASPSSTTTYKVVVTGVNGCKDSINVTVAVDNPPIISVTNNTGICPGDSAQLNASGGVTYQWSPASGLNLTNIPNPKASPLSNTTYKVVVSNNSGCQDSATVSVSLKPKPTAIASPSSSICATDSAQLNATGGNTYQWYPVNGLSNPSVSNPKASPSSTTNYFVIATNTEGCKDTASTTIVVTPLPVLDLGNNFDVCPGASFTLNATTTGASGYQWSTGATNPSITSSAPGLYYVTVSLSGCNKQLKDSITVSPGALPTVSLGKDTTACEFIPVLIKPKTNNVSSYLWSTGSTDTAITVTTEGLYTVTVQNDCGTAADDIFVKINPCADDVFFPSAFTPNRSGVNDVFKAGYLRPNNLNFYELRVYNRWGELVFKTNDLAKGWDGYYKGKLQTTGVFVWYARYKKTATDKVVLKKGTVTLII